MEKIIRSEEPEWFGNFEILADTKIAELDSIEAKEAKLTVTLVSAEKKGETHKVQVKDSSGTKDFIVDKDIDLQMGNSKIGDKLLIRVCYSDENKWKIEGFTLFFYAYFVPLMNELSRMTNSHCTYTDVKLTNQDIDQFIPKEITNKKVEVDNWENLFIVDGLTKHIRGDKYDKLLLKPDADDYDFDKYFEIDFDKGEILPKSDLNEKDKKRAEITINIFGLNNERLVHNRRGELEGFLRLISKGIDEFKESDVQKLIKKHKETKQGFDIDIENYSFRFYLKRFLEKYRFIKNKHIKSISIKKYFCIEDFEIDDIQDKKEIYLLGENGDGKTIVLQAISLAAKALPRDYLYQYLDGQYANNFSIKVQDKDGNDYNFNTDITSVHTNIYAYGVGRLNNHSKPDKDDCLSLFKYNSNLKDPVELFKDVQRLELLKKGKIKLETVKSMFEDLLENKVKIEETEAGDFIFKEKGAELKFKQLSDGYRSVLIWLSDLLNRLTKNNPDIQKLADFKAVVLVDEIGCFLHPKWEYTIVRKLRKMFPEIQWIFTTHSPIVTLGASNDAVFYKFYKEEGITKVSEPFNMKTYANRMLSSFVTSPLFNLSTARPAAFEGNGEDLETGDYIYTLIHKEIQERLKKQPLPEGEIKELVSQLIDKYEKAGKI